MVGSRSRRLTWHAGIGGWSLRVIFRYDAFVVMASFWGFIFGCTGSCVKGKFPKIEGNLTGFELADLRP